MTRSAAVMGYGSQDFEKKYFFLSCCFPLVNAVCSCKKKERKKNRVEYVVNFFHRTVKGVHGMDVWS